MKKYKLLPAMMPPKRVDNKRLMSYGRDQGLCLGMGQAKTNESVPGQLISCPLAHEQPFH